MEYSRNFGSNFPDSLISVGTKKDIDDSVKDLIAQYYNYIENGNIAGAKSLYDENKALLEPYMINMEYINRLEEEIWNAHVSTLNKLTTIISSKPPALQSENCFWLQEY